MDRTFIKPQKEETHEIEKLSHKSKYSGKLYRDSNQHQAGYYRGKVHLRRHLVHCVRAWLGLLAASGKSEYKLRWKIKA